MCERCAELRKELHRVLGENEVLRSENAILRLRLDGGSVSENALRFYTVEQVCEKLQLSPYTVKRYISAGKLPAWQDKPGGAFRIGHNDLVGFIAARTVEKIETYEC